MKSRPMFLRALKTRTLPQPRPLLLRPPQSVSFRPLSTTARLLNESQSKSQEGANQSNQSKQNEKKPETNAPPQSPWKIFIQTLKEEIEKNQGWQDQVKQLQGEVDKASDSRAMKAAREMYEKARITNMIKENPRIQAAARGLQSAGMSASEATARALQDAGVVEALERLTNFGRRFSRPIMDSTVGKAIIEAIDDIGMQGYEGKEERRERRRRRLEKTGGAKRVKANAEAGEALVAVEGSAPSTSRISFLQNSPAYQRFMENYYESDDPLYSALRSVGTRVGRLFDENEQAKVIRAIREVDPSFKMDHFQRALKEFIVPEVIDAYLSADREDMKAWMSEAAYNVSWAVLGEYIKQGLVSSSSVLEISSVDVAQARFINETVPIFLVVCEAQEIQAWKNAKTGEVEVGDINSVQRARYAFGLTMVETELENELTGGWKVVEFVRRGV